MASIKGFARAGYRPGSLNIDTGEVSHGGVRFDPLGKMFVLFQKDDATAPEFDFMGCVAFFRHAIPDAFKATEIEQFYFETCPEAIVKGGPEIMDEVAECIIAAFQSVLFGEEPAVFKPESCFKHRHLE